MGWMKGKGLDKVESGLDEGGKGGNRGGER